MTVLEESRKNYIDAHNKRKKLDDKISLKYAQITRLKNRSNKIHENFWWGDILIRPLMEEVKKAFPELIFNDDRLVPMGIRNAVSVFGRNKNNKTLCAITFTPNDLDNGIMNYDTGEIKDGYGSDSLGVANGFNKVEAPITDIQILLDHVDKQVNKNELTHLR